jgi:hypothetical protein
MAKNKFRNFDSMIEEKRKVAPRFQMFGKEHTLAPTPRYEAIIELNRLSKRGKEEVVSEDEAFAIFGMIIGEQLLAELRSNKEFTMEIASELVNWALSEYGLADNSEKEHPKVAESH